MRMHSAVTSLSWIPSEAISGLLRIPFDMGFTHYDEPPPDHVSGLAELRTLGAADRFRFANRLAAWVEVQDGAVVDSGFASDSAGVMGGSTLRFGPWSARAPGIEFPVIRQPVESTASAATFVQTVGGRAAMPAPRRVERAPYVQVRAPMVWTTLALTLHADGRVDHELRGASAFPRHWVYADGAVTAKTALADVETWYRGAHGRHTPWGGEDEAALVTAAEDALSRSVSRAIMRAGRKPDVRQLPTGTVLTRQGERDGTLYLLLDGVLLVQVDGQDVIELGPGVVVGQRALLEGGARTATLVARTPVRVAAVSADAVDRAALERISESQRREDHRP